MKKIMSVIALAAAATLALATPALAADEAPPAVGAEEAEYLDALLENAGQPAKFTSVDPDQNNGISARGFVPAPYNCTLYPSSVHLRTKSGEKRNVGAKPYTRCDKAVSAIKQVSTVYTVEWAGAHYRPVLKDVPANNVKQKNLTQQNVQYFCANKNNSNFMQTTKGEITLNTRYYSVVSTAIEPLACGY